MPNVTTNRDVSRAAEPPPPLRQTNIKNCSRRRRHSNTNIQFFSILNT